MAQQVKQNRDEFPTKTRELLAKRAGYRCSVPGCYQQTIGPAKDSDKYTWSGRACHIVSASPDSGPRADPNMASKDRKSIENGIWCCSRHSDIIDADETSYPVELLKRWKKDHEDRIRLEQSGVLVGNGIVKSMTLHDIAHFNKPQNITFSNKNLILGECGSGKSCICEMIAALASPVHIQRWHPLVNNRRSLIEIETFTATLIKWQLQITTESISYRANEIDIPRIFTGFKVFILANQPFCLFDHFENPTENDEDSEFNKRLASFLGLEVPETLSVLRIMSSRVGNLIYRINVDLNGATRIQTHPNAPILPYASLSSGEQQRFIVEVYLRLAEYSAMFAPTILILDQHGFTTIDNEGIRTIVKLIARAKDHYQVFLTLFCWPNDLDVNGFRTLHLIENQGKEGGIVIVDGKQS